MNACDHMSNTKILFKKRSGPYFEEYGGGAYISSKKNHSIPKFTDIEICPET